MFLRLSLRLSKKVPLIGIFSLGVFVIIAAILNKVYSFSDPFSDEWVYWYVRESSTALIVANLPFVWLFYRKIFRNPELDCIKERAIWQHTEYSDPDILNPSKERQARCPWRKEELRSERSKPGNGRHQPSWYMV